MSNLESTSGLSINHEHFYPQNIKVLIQLLLGVGACSLVVTVATLSNARSIMRTRGFSPTFSALPVVSWLQDMSKFERIIQDLDDEELKRKYRRTCKLFDVSIVCFLLVVLAMFLLILTRRFL